MIRKQDALTGGMPVYKWIGNQVLSTFQNFMLGTNLSEFHSGYRLYSVARAPQDSVRAQCERFPFRHRHHHPVSLRRIQNRSNFPSRPFTVTKSAA